MQELFNKKFFVLTLLAVVMPFAAFAKVDYLIENQPQVIEMALSFDNFGELKQKDNGYLYVNVQDEFIGEILPLIECPGRIVPPRHYSSKKGIGAHVSVMYENERISKEIWEIAELGNTYTFDVTELRSVKIVNRDGHMKKLWLIALDAPQLEELRESYGLSSKLKGHDFHITIGYQMPAVKGGDCEVELEIEFVDDFEEYAEAA